MDGRPLFPARQGRKERRPTAFLLRAHRVLMSVYKRHFLIRKRSVAVLLWLKN